MSVSYLKNLEDLKDMNFIISASSEHVFNLYFILWNWYIFVIFHILATVKPEYMQNFSCPYGQKSIVLQDTTYHLRQISVWTGIFRLLAVLSLQVLVDFRWRFLLMLLSYFKFQVKNNLYWNWMMVVSFFFTFLCNCFNDQEKW